MFVTLQDLTEAFCNKFLVRTRMATRRVKGRKGRKTRRQRGGLNFGKLNLGKLKRKLTFNRYKTFNQKAISQLESMVDKALKNIKATKSVNGVAHDLLIEEEGRKGTHMVLNHWEKEGHISKAEHETFTKKLEELNKIVKNLMGN